MRRLILISALIATVGLPATAAAASGAGSATDGNHSGKLSSVYLIGTLDRRDRPRVFARFDRTLPAAKGRLRGARVRLVVHGDVRVRGTGVFEPVHTVITRRLASVRPNGAWRIELPLTLGQAERIERAAVSPDLLRIEGTAVQTVLTPAGDSLPSSRIDGVTESSEEEEFEGEEIVNGSIGATWIVEEPGCEHTREGCAVTEVKSHWSHPEWDGYGGGEDNEHGDLSMTACNGEFTEICEGAFGGIFAAKEINAISPYPEGTAFFNVAEGASGITPEMEIAAHYNEHEGGSPTVACRIPEYAYVPTPVTDGPEPTISCSQTVEGEGEEDEESEGVAYDYYMVTTIWPSGSNPPSPGP